MDLGIEGRVALVSASSKGLGREAACSLAAEGARLAICARGGEALGETAEMLRGLGAEVLDEVCDLTDSEQAQELVEKTLAHFGQLDILVTNCGGPPPGKFLDHDIERWREAVDLNLMSAVYLCRAAAPQMIERGWGRIVLMTSISVKQPIDGLILSNSVRAAVVGLGKTLAAEFGPNGVLVNSVCPGYFLTERVHSLAEKLADNNEVSPAEMIENWAAAGVLGRVGDPSEFGPLVAFLCSERASYITGTAMAIDGGLCRSLL
ncbi:MAG TPA: SDR family oxidoreductase [Myxococcota bacterium]|nr:SDR family oxidoreductase [Myxococcota bacterium]